MSDKNPTLFGKEWNFDSPTLDENNLVEEDTKTPDSPPENLTYEDYLKGSTYNPGQTTSHLVDKDKNERVLDILTKKDAVRSKVHYGADDVNDLIARNQSTGEKWRYGLTKLGGKTITAATGGLAMLPSAIGTTTDWLVGGHEGEESWRDIWDNDFQRGLDSINEWMDGELPNYYSKAEQERAWYKNILGDGAANFWANDVGNGISFIAGAVLTEVALSAATAATGGALAPVQAAATARLTAKAAQILKGIGKGKALTNAARGTKNS